MQVFQPPVQIQVSQPPVQTQVSQPPVQKQIYQEIIQESDPDIPESIYNMDQLYKMKNLLEENLNDINKKLKLINNLIDERNKSDTLLDSNPVKNIVKECINKKNGKLCKLDENKKCKYCY